ncbi:FKBP-type peptidyl-prolyl cis-trans isomerase [Pedobacter sp. P351]|uniref:FKBP-type peptidyl-prolyl cis-trans isomerase n=1 Tax=Pedobacter superstes TaxID=3133441 RepID=UPI0030B723A1
MKLNLYKSFCLLFIALFLFSACEKEYETIQELDAKDIESYISRNNLSFEKGTNGIYYKVLKAGTGSDLAYSDKIPLIYTVRSLDGTYINADTIANHYGGSGQFFGYFTPEALRTTIKEVLKKRRGEIRVLVPSNLAYGRNGSGAIPGNASLDYTVKLLDEQSIPAYDDASINSYMQSNNLSGFTKTSAGLYYKITALGTGSPIHVDSILTIQYTGKFLNGSIFQQTGTDNAVLTLSETIDAWKQALPLIKGGGTMRVLAPSALGYGTAGRQDQFGSFSIPPFSCLDFDIKVIDVAQP